MKDFIQIILDFIYINLSTVALSSIEICLVAGLLMFLNSLVMLPPSEFVCVSLGIVVSRRTVDFMVIVIIATLANLCGTLPWYWLGVLHGKKNKTIVFKGKRGLWGKIRFLYTGKLDNIERAYEQYGFYLLLTLRNIPVIRSICSYPAGRIQMTVGRFLLASLIGIMIWVLIWVTLGLTIGEIARQYHWHIAAFIGFFVFSALKILSKFLGRYAVNE